MPYTLPILIPTFPPVSIPTLPLGSWESQLFLWQSSFSVSGTLYAEETWCSFVVCMLWSRPSYNGVSSGVSSSSSGEGVCVHSSRVFITANALRECAPCSTLISGSLMAACASQEHGFHFAPLCIFPSPRQWSALNKYWWDCLRVSPLCFRPPLACCLLDFRKLRLKILSKPI